MTNLSFDFSSLSASESLWDSVRVWLALAVAVGVSMEAVTEFDTLAEWLRLDRQETFALRHGMAKAGLLILIFALACEVGVGVRVHTINQNIDAGLNREIGDTQAREQTLIDETAALSAENKDLEGIASKQEGALGLLAMLADAFDATANKLRGRMEKSLSVLDRAQQDTCLFSYSHDSQSSFHII
jgi:hypothetical protein